ncbi:MAG: hypothetical protein PHU61_01910 [Candidatus Absconditabacteria bacterium]|nr:hypothetical protein [Candidatus Absconditabacteria bacterium]MDD3868465.1 hypothetical protein [Candidatus Absconditabacteria bacterium]MDD4713961.1 hypothetical protein [Candidatus Absconditabacteria bacterium]
MQGIRDALRKRLSQQFRGKNMIGSIAINCIHEYFSLEKNEKTIREKEAVEGYIRHNKLFLKIQDQEIKIQVFKEKKKLIELINQHLEKLGYKERIIDIFTK